MKRMLVMVLACHPHFTGNSPSQSCQSTARSNLIRTSDKTEPLALACAKV